MSTRRARLDSRLTLILALGTLVVLALSGVIDPLQSGALTMLPALALAVMMLTRPYLGERVIGRLRGRPPRRPRAVSPTVPPVRPHACSVRGGRLLAVALAGRAPPHALVNR